MEQEDYSKIYEYESMGKEYAGEKACISLTSWKARINTVSKTLYSLIKMCPGFHIVLVLSKDEFPLMEKELPDNLMLFVENKLIELFWIRPNLKSFKKVLFTMDKYRDVPVISADDDCIYKYNYAEELYNNWYQNKNCCVTYRNLTNFKGSPGNWGAASLYPPYFYKNYGLKCLTNEIINSNLDDGYYCILRFHLCLKETQINKNPFVYVFLFHTKEASLCSNYLNNNKFCTKIMNHIDKIVYACVKYS